jgi:hypothetical protein
MILELHSLTRIRQLEEAAAQDKRKTIFTAQQYSIKDAICNLKSV